MWSIFLVVQYELLIYMTLSFGLPSVTRCDLCCFLFFLFGGDSSSPKCTKEQPKSFHFMYITSWDLLIRGYCDKDTDRLPLHQRLLGLCCSHAYLPFSEVLKQLCFSCLIMLISNFMEKNKLLSYNLESNGRGLADQRGRSFRVGATFGYFKSVRVICSLTIVYTKRWFQGKPGKAKRVWRLTFFLNIYE